MKAPLYSLRTKAGGWLITKFDEDFNAIAVYNITVDGQGVLSCSCPSRKQPCKHLTRFLPNMMSRADSEFFYEDDGGKGRWHNPLFGIVETGLEGPSAPAESQSPPVQAPVEEPQKPMTEAPFKRRV